MHKGSMNGAAERFREALAGPGPIVLAGAHDVLSAMLLEEAGFGAIFMSGYGVAASFLGNPDIGLTSLTETALMAKNICSRVSVPVVADADNGYGNEDNVIRTIHELEAAGCAALTIEDQVLPKRCGHTSNKKILPLPLYMKKLEAALRARKTPLAIIARTDSMDLDEGIKRGQAFHAAGADVVLVDGVRSIDDAKRIAHEVPGPKQINLIYGGKTELLSSPEFYDLGFKVILYSTPTLYIMVHALREKLAVLKKTHRLDSISKDSVTFREFQHFIETRYRESEGVSVTDDGDLAGV